MSLGKTNYCLKGLINKGLAEVKRSKNSNNKIKYSYIITPKGVSEKLKLIKQLLKLKIEKYDVLADEIDALKSEAGDK